MKLTTLHIYIVCLIVFFTVDAVQPYHLKCPEAVHWKLRAADKCGHPSNKKKYFCLYDAIKKLYTEGCELPEWEKIGHRRIVSGSFTRGNCSKKRYQPFDFKATESSVCAYDRTLCSEEGQVTSNDGSGDADRTCRCDFSRGYNYTQSPKNLCDCRPTIDDCSCVQGKLNYVHDVKALDLQCPKMTVQDNKENQDVSTKSVKTIQNSIQVPTFRRDGGCVIAILVCLMLVIITCMIFILLAVDSEPRCIIKTEIFKFLHRKFYDSIQENSSTRDNVDGKDNNSGKSDESSVASEKEHNETVIESGEFFSDEEINFLRIVHLLFVVASLVVRMVFNEEIKPDELSSTLVRNRKKLNKLIKNKDRTLAGIFHPCKKGETISSGSFDIKLLINLLKVLNIINIGDQLPLRSDTRKDALLSRILYYRTVMVDAVDGRLSNSEFQNYWKEIGQTLLRMSARHLTEINRKKTLKEYLLALSPIKQDDIRLQRYVLLTERFPQLILQQLIREYCLDTYNDETLIQFLEAEKHNLFHRRKKQPRCCICGEKTFSFIIPDSLWKKLYMYQHSDKSHICKHKRKCVLKSGINFNFDLRQENTSVLLLLILNSTGLFRYTVRQMYANSISSFLERCKHSIFHAVDKFVEVKCCNYPDKACAQIKAMLTHDDWMELFTHTDTDACCIKDCCCHFSVKDNVNIETMDDTLLFNIMSVAGPFHVFNKCNKNTLNNFLCWDGKNSEYLCANEELIGAVKNTEFVQNLKSKFTLSGQTTDQLEKGYVGNWILKDVPAEKASSGSKTDLVLLLQYKGELATQNVTVSSRASVPFSGKSRIKWTLEEENFLRLNYLLNQVVCPVVRGEFDRHLSRSKLQIITDNYYRDIASKEKQNDSHSTHSDKEPLRLTSVQRNRIFLTKRDDNVATPGNFDLALMIRIFEENRKTMVMLKTNEELYRHLENIKRIRTTITRSPNGQLTNEEFEEHWDTLSKVVVSLKDEEDFERHLNNLKTQPILKDVH